MRSKTRFGLNFAKKVALGVKILFFQNIGAFNAKIGVFSAAFASLSVKSAPLALGAAPKNISGN